MMSSDLPPQDTFDIRILMAKSVKYTVNFLEAKEDDLYRYVYTVAFVCLSEYIEFIFINNFLLLPFSFGFQDRDSL